MDTRSHRRQLVWGTWGAVALGVFIIGGFVGSLIAGPQWDAVVQAFGSVVAGMLAVIGAGIGAWALLRQSDTQRAIALAQDRERTRATLVAMSAQLTAMLPSFDTAAQARATRVDLDLESFARFDPARFRIDIPEILWNYFQYGVVLPIEVAQRLHDFIAYVNSLNVFISIDIPGRLRTGIMEQGTGRELAKRYETAFNMATQLALDVTKVLGKADVQGG